MELKRIELNNQINRKNNALRVLNTNIATIAKDREKSKETLITILRQIDEINSNTKELMGLRQKIAGGESDKFALLMYSNIIQQNISYANALQQRLATVDKEINSYSVEEATKVREISDLQLDKNNLELQRDRRLEIEKSKFEKELATKKIELEKVVNDAEIALEEYRVKKPQELSMQEENVKENIKQLETKHKTLSVVEIVQPPFASIQPAKPEKLKIIILGFCIAIFAAVFTAFIVEFWIRNRQRF